MIDTEQALQDIVRVAQSGRDLFVDLGSRAREGEVREAFGYVADVKKRLIESLSGPGHRSRLPAGVPARSLLQWKHSTGMLASISMARRRGRWRTH